MDLDGEGQRDRGAVGLVGRVAPIAVVFGLEDLPGEVDARAPTQAHGIGHRRDVEEGLVRRKGIRERAHLHAAVCVGDLTGTSCEAVHGMQHADPEAIAQEGCARLTADRVAQRAVCQPLDVDRRREGLGVEASQCGDVDGEGVTPVVDLLAHYSPGPGGPVAILEDDVDPAEDLLVAEPHAADVPGVVVQAQWARDEWGGHAQPALPTR